MSGLTSIPPGFLSEGRAGRVTVSGFVDGLVEGLVVGFVVGFVEGLVVGDVVGLV